MSKVCRQQKMTKPREPNYKQQCKPKQVGTAAMATGTTSTEEKEEEASWDAALRASVHFVDIMKPATGLMVAMLVMMCIPATATVAVQLNKTEVFPDGLTLCEPPIGGGHLMALPSMPDCHKSKGLPTDKVTIRLFIRKHNSKRGEIYAMQRIKTTRCTHLNWLFSFIHFPFSRVRLSGTLLGLSQERESE